MKADRCDQTSLIHETLIAGTPERVYAALTQPAELLKWWVVQGQFRLLHVECDPRPGGKWLMRVDGCDGRCSTVAGEYRKVEPPHLLEFTWTRDDDHVETIVRWELEEKSGKTLVRVVHSGLTSSVLRERNKGWPVILSLLKTYCEPGQPK
jgi:uncharacterized protein YndB with AHSA1/START domain